MSGGGEPSLEDENLLWGRRTLSGGGKPCLGRRTLSGGGEPCLREENLGFKNYYMIL
jgi:hypothetical protein